MSPPEILYTDKLALGPIDLFGATALCPSCRDDDVAPHCAVSPNILPLIVDFNLPHVFEGTPSSFITPSNYVVASQSLDLSCTVVPDLLPYLWRLAQQGNTLQTHELDLVPAPAVIEVDNFPLSAQVLLESDPLPVASISGDLLESLSATTVFGMNYRDRIWHALTEQDEEEPAPRRKSGTKPLSKSYLAEPEQKEGRKPTPKVPSLWDLLYVVLQPPLDFDRSENLFLPHKPFDYQPAGVEFLMHNESALLADEMGTGKTVMTILAIKILMQRGNIQSALIVCPLSVLREWDRHLIDWSPELWVKFIRGNQEKRKADWKMPAHVYVTTYDTLRMDVANGVLVGDDLSKFDVVVLDEAQGIKNTASGRSRAIKQLRARRRWALTGTPIENKIEDVASIFEFLRPGYLTPFDLYPSRIKERIAPYFLRRLKKDVLRDLPPKIRQEVRLELDPIQRAEYDQVEGQVRSELSALGTQVTQFHIMQQLQRLKQICNFASGQSTSPKLRDAKELVEQIIANSEKVIIFSQYLAEGVDKLEQALKPYGTAKIVGGQTEKTRDAEIQRFVDDPTFSVPVLLASVKAGGVGLNLTQASYVIHFDHWWNPAVMWQAEARVHRSGQTRGVNVYSYWMVDTIEDRIHSLLEEKGLLFADIVDGLSTDQIDAAISRDEWLEKIFLVSRKSDSQLVSEKRAAVSLSLTEIRDKLFELTPVAFEHLVKEVMRCWGYPNVKVTQQTRDGGIDVIASRNAADGVVRVVAQCKRYRGMVGVEVARELLGVIAADKSISKGFLVTSGDFSLDCFRFCESTGLVALVSGLQLANYIKQFGIAI
jgi:superfamily II DNA or RNA helicase